MNIWLEALLFLVLTLGGYIFFFYESWFGLTIGLDICLGVEQAESEIDFSGVEGFVNSLLGLNKES